MTSPHDQSAYQVRFDWGLEGARTVAADAAIVVIVDVLSFTTTVELATTLGLAIVPCAPEDAERIAASRNAPLAGPRGTPLSLAPSSMVLSSLMPSSLVASSLAPSSLVPSASTAEAVARLGGPAAPGEPAASAELVVPSPNGSRIAAAVSSDSNTVIAGSLRNATAVSRAILERQQGERLSIAIIAAGEARPDDSARFAVEDLLGAGAIIDALAALGLDACSPEAAAAAASFTGLKRATRHLITASASGRELAERGFAEDVRIATAVDASTTVPILREFAFRA